MADKTQAKDKFNQSSAPKPKLVRSGTEGRGGTRYGTFPHSKTKKG